MDSNVLKRDIMSSGAASMRSSNIELLRIVAMLAIVAHHYVVNSTVMNLFDPMRPTVNSIFLQLWGMWGKTAINVFVLITGYFMCKRELAPKKVSGLFAVWMLYSYLLYITLAVIGLEAFSYKRFILLPLDFIKTANIYFTASFLWFYIGIPLYNIVVKNVSRDGLKWIISWLLALFVLPTMLYSSTSTFHFVFWYMTLYFIGAFVRLYPWGWMQNVRVCKMALVCCICFTIAVQVVASVIPTCAKYLAMFFVWESNFLMSVVIAILMFLVFKNATLRNSRAVNVIASTMFGVLCIHTAAANMGTYLWDRLFSIRNFAEKPLAITVMHAMLCTLLVFAFGVATDLIRQTAKVVCVCFWKRRKYE